MDRTEIEIQHLKKQRATQEAERADRLKAGRLRTLERRREELLNGSWKPWHAYDCDTCLRAILEKNPEGICEYAKSGGGCTERWWE